MDVNMNNTLAFLDEFLGFRVRLYKGFDRLLTDFDSDKWEIVFAHSNVPSINIDFCIRLSDGSLLSEDKHSCLLLAMKYWICASVHPDNTRGRGLTYSDATASNIICSVLNLIDYFLIRDDYYKLYKYGFEAISKDDVYALADELFSSGHRYETVYRWSHCVSDYLKSELNNANRNELKKIIKESDIKFHEITNSQRSGVELDLDAEEIIYARAWLYQNDLYTKNIKSGYKYSPNRKRVSEIIYKPLTLRGAAFTKPNIAILSIVNIDSSRREYERVAVKDYNESEPTATSIRQLKSAFNTLLSLHDESFSYEKLSLPPISAIRVFDSYQVKLNVDKRTASLPSKVVFKALREAVEFHIEYSEHLIASLDNVLHSYSRKINELADGQRDSITKVISDDEFNKLLHPKISQKGVTKWGFRNREFKLEGLKSNPGLGVLFSVYYGAVAITVGVIMARRQTELRHLKVDTCLDDAKKNLIFNKAKSTRMLGGKRELVARPIDEIAVEMIEALIKIQRLYLKYGFIKKTGNLFAVPSYNQANKLLDPVKSHHNFSNCIDNFCDYFEMPVNKDGQRYYIRVHQLRRFFALSFFWGNGFGGLDTLRWFMGHTDPEHVYRYITESIPGEVLRHAKSQFVTETITEHKELQKLILEKYNTDDFTILTDSEIENYIDELLTEGEVEVEPEFIEVDDGKTYRILVNIVEKRHA